MSVYLIVRAYYYDIPLLVSICLLSPFLVTEVADIYMYRPTIRSTRHFLVYNPKTKDWFLGRDEKVDGFFITLDEKVRRSKERGEASIRLTNDDMDDMVDNGGLGRANIIHGVVMPSMA